LGYIFQFSGNAERGQSHSSGTRGKKFTKQ
jgi:hypothetical protein